MSTLTVLCQWEDEMAKRSTHRLPSNKSVHPPLSQLCILNFPFISTKSINFPPYFLQIYNFPPFFVQFMCFLPNLSFFASPLFLCIMLYMYWMCLPSKAEAKKIK